MRLPSLLDYQRAVQTPTVAFRGVEVLRSGRALTNAQGMPVVASGGFAATFRIETGATQWAVRCFHKQTKHDRHLDERYRRIGEFVTANSDLSFLTDVVYRPDGIIVEGIEYPTVTMPWVVGTPLGIWIEDWADNQQRKTADIDTVRVRIAEAVQQLRTRGAAHGDLQHGNILVRPDLSIWLIDYDGMYLPALDPLEAIEEGHRNYQHPGRGARYDDTLDLFAASVIDLSLLALKQRPELWDTYGGTGENLVLQATDFVDSEKSTAFNELASLNGLADATQRLQNACQVDYAHVPATLAGRAVTAATAASFHIPTADVFLAEDVDEIRSRQGQTVTVVGTVTFAIVNKGPGGEDVALINFGNYENGDFTIVGYGPVSADLFGQHGQYSKNGKRLMPPLRGWSVAITGTVVLYENKNRRTLVPQIQLERAGLLRNLDKSKFGALRKVAERRKAESQQQATSARRVTGKKTPAAGTQQGSPSTATSSAVQNAANRRPTLDARQDARNAAINKIYSSGFAKPQEPSTPTAQPARPRSATNRKSASNVASGNTRAAKPQSTHTPKPSSPPWRAGPPTSDPAWRPQPVPPQYRRETLPQPPPQARPVLRPKRRSRRRDKAAGAVLVAIAAIVLVVILSQHDSGPVAGLAATEPVVFASPSMNLTCRMVASGGDAGVRCEAGRYTYTPPSPPSGCTDPQYGHALQLTSDGVGFPCTPPILSAQSSVVLNYGSTQSAGPFSCSSAADGMTCFDTRPGGHRFRLERDSYQLG